MLNHEGQESGSASGSRMFQTRACFTFIRQSELLRHSAVFGAFSVEFDIDELRRLGACPVLYLPQPVGGLASGFDRFATHLVHQIRDTTILLKEMQNLEDQLKSPEVQKVRYLTMVESSGEQHKLHIDSLSFILRYLKGNKGSLRSMAYFIDSTANLFYHADSARPTVYTKGPDLAYYQQMEWRLFSGPLTPWGAIDRELTNSERRAICKLSPFFSSMLQCPDDSQIPLIQGTRIIDRAFGKALVSIIRRIWAPDVMADQVLPLVPDAKIEVATLEYRRVLDLRKALKSRP
jgi:hypothetical protein